MTIASLVGRSRLDADLAALVWTLLEGRVALVVTGESGAMARDELRSAFVAQLHEAPPRSALDLDGVEPSPGAALRSAILGNSEVGSGVVPSVEAATLADLFARLGAPPHGLSDDELRALGVVLVLSDEGPGGEPRVVAAHLLRRVERDAQGHLQRRPPAVLATWDPETDRFEDFSWGIVPELADRVGMSRTDFERTVAERATDLRRDLSR